jgi:hypothetical protein
MADNKYIDEPVILEDVRNDDWVIDKIQSRLLDAVKETQDLQRKMAMVKYSHILEETVDSLDDILHKIINPIKDKTEEGIKHHDITDA